MNTDVAINQEEIVAMGIMNSKIPELLESRGWGAMDLVRRGLAVDTSYKLKDGDINITIGTLTLLCDIFEVDSVSEVIEYSKNGKE